MRPIPTRTRIPILTDLLEFRQMVGDPLGFSKDMVARYGDVCYIPVPGVKNYFIHDPEIIKEVLATQSGKFCKSRMYRALKRFLGEGLFTSEGDFHREQRRMINPAFHKQRIQEYAETMVDCTLNETKTWIEGNVINISEAMVNITMQVITRTMFGSSLELDLIEKVSSIITRLMVIAGKIFQNPLYILLFEKDIRTPLIKEFYELKKEAFSIIDKFILDGRNNSHNERTDLLSMLLNAKDEDGGKGMSDDQIRDEVMTIFLAGHETTSTALSWVWYLLGTHPDIGEQFYKEIQETIGHRKPEYNDYQNLVTTRNIIKETLRLYPPAWTFAREAKEDVTINEYFFPKGSLLCTLTYLVHRDAKYFKNPDEFRPDRWQGDETANLPKYAWFPFGGGNRMCIGEGFAWMEATMILAIIASKFRLELKKGFTTTMNPGFTLRPKDNIQMVVSKVYN